LWDGIAIGNNHETFVFYSFEGHSRDSVLKSIQDQAIKQGNLRVQHQ